MSRGHLSWKSLLALILCNVIWSTNPAVAKIVLEDFRPLHVAWGRFFTAMASYFLLAPIFKNRTGKDLRLFMKSKKAGEWSLIILLGFMTFCFSPLTQITGLAASRATDNALIVAMEPIITVLIAWIFVGESVGLGYLAAFAISLFGFCLLAGLTPSNLSHGLDSHMTGNLIMLISLLGEASYSTLGRKLMGKHSAWAVFGTSLLIGVVLMTGFAWSIEGFFPFHRLTLRSLACFLWLGALGTSVSYLYWMVALEKAAVASLALTLFVQPVLGAFWGYAFLHETLSLIQWLGGVLIIMAVFGQTAWSARWLVSSKSGK